MGAAVMRWWIWITFFFHSTSNSETVCFVGFGFFLFVEAELNMWSIVRNSHTAEGGQQQSNWRLENDDVLQKSLMLYLLAIGVPSGVWNTDTAILARAGWTWNETCKTEKGFQFYLF